ncbi:guanyl-nucleotide exchange factor [Ophiocordyceps camponoti-floridani]|uniref:Guanyl-nucleotide exchange factor n=1 Tax=Ophiocordyceps camponoti-floridani TaxID=2030778 RepID=A0A8H4VBG7_9HYPO|nr:guanyl-nucleotide exchange factor [Ophiocordyceps camponoti-floridani]
MPLLRRRGNQVSETDMRRHTAAASRASEDNSVGRTAEAAEPATKNVRNGSRAAAPPQLPMPLVRPKSPKAEEERRQPQTVLAEDTSLPQPSRGEAESDSDNPRVPSLGLDVNKHRRFSLLRFRNASDPQLSLRARQQAEKPPPIPRTPAIITTAPTVDVTGPRRVTSRVGLAAKFRRSSEVHRTEDSNPKTRGRKPFREESVQGGGRPTLATLDEPSPSPATMSMASGLNGAVLSLSDNRQSESSRSDASSADRNLHASPPSTIKKAQGTTAFSRLRRAMKPSDQMFPMAHLPQKNSTISVAGSATSLGLSSTPRPSSARSASTPRGHAQGRDDGSPAPTAAATLRPNRGSDSRSNHSSPTRVNLLRGRSSTLSSMGRDSTDEQVHPPTTRTSLSTGRKSFGDLFGLSRIRQNSELSRQGSLTPATPGSITSKSNSLQLPRGSLVLPERRDEESPAKYLKRVEEVISRGMIASALSKGTDPFFATVLRSYMRKFSFFGDPMDMALRKLLMEAVLPKETQQIDRCLQAFANRYHECNPGIYSSPDQAYFIAFSLLILHTDVFNKNNKHKMQKADYLKNTRGEGIFDEILECFYDNISYTPFIHVEDDLDLSHERVLTNASRKKPSSSANAGDTAKRAAKEPIDPYTLILDGNLDALRPNLKDAMQLDDHYNYLGTAASLNLKDLQKTFFRTAVLQIVSARSRPDAFMSEKTAFNPEDAHPGIVDIKITKVGLLWRKEIKKRKARSPWQEWGAILTGAQLYLFRNTSWVKNLMHQYENHIKAGHDGIPIIFKPPLEEFKPDALMSTQGAIALLDTTYKKHKNAFVYVRQGKLDEVFLADNEEERNDWLAKLNYAAAFRTSGVRMQGVIGGNYDGLGRRGMRRLDSSDATQQIQTPTGMVSIARGRIDYKMAQDLQTARREGIEQKVTEANGKVENASRQLEDQLRNARHLQILAPIQPRTREYLLSAAARMAAQLEWTRIEIWKEKCHRDILVQDLADDRPVSAIKESPPTKPQADAEPAPSMSLPRPKASHLEPLHGRLNASDPVPQMDVVSPGDQVFQTPPQSAGRPRCESHDPSHPVSDRDSTRPDSISTLTSSPVLSAPSTPPVQQVSSRDKAGTPSLDKGSRGQDEVDAGERDFLKQTGLYDSKINRNSMDRTNESTVADSSDAGLDRGKIRRSLQRTLRESAGHLSHHRGRKGKEVALGGTGDEGPPDNMLTRSTGSFVVHGKKASVINIGAELQSLSPDDKMLARKAQQPEEQAVLSPAQSGCADEDYLSAQETVSDSHDADGRRESTTSAGTATARSFRELHRRYSTAQAARSASVGGRLTIRSDGESEAAVSFSDAPRQLTQTSSSVDTEEPRVGDVLRSTHSQTLRQEARDDSSDDGDAPQESEHLSPRPVQAVNA